MTDNEPIAPHLPFHFLKRRPERGRRTGKPPPANAYRQLAVSVPEGQPPPPMQPLPSTHRPEPYNEPNSSVVNLILVGCCATSACDAASSSRSSRLSANCQLIHASNSQRYGCPSAANVDHRSTVEQ